MCRATAAAPTPPDAILDRHLSANANRLASVKIFFPAIAAATGEGTEAIPLTAVTLRSCGGAYRAADRTAKLKDYQTLLVTKDPRLAHDPTATTQTEDQFKATQLRLLESLFETAKVLCEAETEGTATSKDDFTAQDLKNCSNTFASQHGFEMGEDNIAPLGLLKYMFKLFVVAGVYPNTSDTLITKFKARKPGQSVLDDSTTLNFVSTSSGMLEAKATAFKDQVFTDAGSLLDALELKLMSLVLIAAGHEAPLGCSGREYGLVHGKAQWAAYPEVRKILATLPAARNLPVAGVRFIIDEVERYVGTAMRAPTFRTPSACFADVRPAPLSARAPSAGPRDPTTTRRYRRWRCSSRTLLRS